MLQKNVFATLITSTATMENLRKQVAELIKEAGLSLAELSAATGVHRSQICRFKNGQFKKSSKNLRKFLDLLQKRDSVAKIDSELSAAVHEVWDGTPQGKKKLIRILESLKGWG